MLLFPYYLLNHKLNSSDHELSLYPENKNCMGIRLAVPLLESNDSPVLNGKLLRFKNFVYFEWHAFSRVSRALEQERSCGKVISISCLKFL